MLGSDRPLSPKQLSTHEWQSFNHTENNPYRDFLQHAMTADSLPSLLGILTQVCPFVPGPRSPGLSTPLPLKGLAPPWRKSFSLCRPTGKHAARFRRSPTACFLRSDPYSASVADWANTSGS